MRSVDVLGDGMNLKLNVNPRRLRWLAVGSVLSTLLALGAFPRAAGPRSDVAPGNTAYDGRFTFVRLSYEMRFGGGGGFFGGDLPWAHDYPWAEQNLTKILEDLSYLKVTRSPNGGNILPVGDPELHKFPFAYMSEPGYWTQTDAEAASVGSYLLKGGFLVFDDFRNEHWYNFETQFKRVLPDAKLVELDVTHPIFHSFFDIKTLELDLMYDVPPTFWGVFEDNDPSRRLMVIANYDADLGEYWEFDGTGRWAVDVTNEAYKFGVNYIMYAMTH